MTYVYKIYDIITRIRETVLLPAWVMWPSLFGGLDSDWTVGPDCGTGLTESCAHPISKQHIHYYTAVYLHHMN